VKRIIPCFGAAAFVLSSSGCVIAPVPLSTKAKDISGNPVRLDLAFLKAGSTTRGEVTKNLGPIDTQVNQANFFWGRWQSSSWGYGGVVAVPDKGGAGGARVWGVHNLLVEFDQQGVVKSWSVVDDKKLLPQLGLLAATSPSLDLSSPLHAKVHVPAIHEVDDHNPAYAVAELVLSADSFECRDAKPSRPNIFPSSCENLQTPRTNIARIEPAISDDGDGNPWLTIVFFKALASRPGRRPDKKLRIGVDPPTLLLLRRYVSARVVDSAGSAGRLWPMLLLAHSVTRLDVQANGTTH
jgi:hypothetical protein